jgi:hypothetical protein
MYRFDVAFFGYPQVGMDYRMRTQFIQTFGAMGENKNRLYDDKAPKIAEMAWRMVENQLLAFQMDWADPTKFNYGANWFEIELFLASTPNRTPATVQTPGLFQAHFMSMYECVLVGNRLWNVSATMELFHVSKQVTL